MTRRPFFLPAAIILIVLAPLSARALDLVFPRKAVSVTVDRLRVVARGDDKTPLTIEVTGADGPGQTFTPASRHGTFSQVVPLAPGKNTISVRQGTGAVSRAVYRIAKDGSPAAGTTRLYLHTKEEISGRCEGCHGDAPGDFSAITQEIRCMNGKCHADFGDKPYKHGPFADGDCVQCHSPHGTANKNFLRGKNEQLCFRCHTEDADMLKSAPYAHFPVKKGQCVACHEPHQSDLEYHLKRKTMTDLCFGCHDPKMVQHKYMHDPVESGDCNACHTPHVSENKGLLYAGGKDLCLTCHEVRKEEFASRYVHKPVAKDCTLCHDPHGSEAPFHLKTRKKKHGGYIVSDKPLIDVCLRCHQKLDPEVAYGITKAKMGHKPVQEGKCTTCHTPHSTNFKKQLNAPEKKICLSCHKKMRKKMEGSRFLHGPVRNNDCGQCHLVHGSDHRKLLRADYTPKFSAPFDLKLYALCFNCHDKKVFLDPESRLTGFRNGKENLHYLHVNRKKKGRSCRTCHDTHASNQPKHIRAKVPFKKRFTINIEFTKTATGGGCVVGCHKPKKYDRVHPESYPRKR